MQWVAARHPALETCHPNLSSAYVIARELRRLTAAEPVPVDEIEEKSIPEIRLRDRPKEPLDLFPREVRDGPLSRGSFVRHPVTAGDSDAFPHLR